MAQKWYSKDDKHGRMALKLHSLFFQSLTKLEFSDNRPIKAGFAPGGGTSLWVRRGCAPVLGSFWPENSGIGVSFYWKISVIGVYFHSEFSGIGGYSKFCNGC